MTVASSDPNHNHRLIPVACSLDRGDTEERLASWQRVFRDLAPTAERTRRGLLRIRLGSPGGHLTDLIDLAVAEKRCCPFFEFTLRIEADGLVFTVEVPDDSAAVLDDFTRLLPTA